MYWQVDVKPGGKEEKTPSISGTVFLFCLTVISPGSLESQFQPVPKVQKNKNKNQGS